MRVKCPRETMYTRDYSLRKSEIKLYAVRIIVKEKNEEKRKKTNKKSIVQSMSIRLNGRLRPWLGTAPATWRATCAPSCALRGRLRSRRPRLLHSACVAADSSLPRCCCCCCSSWGVQDSLWALPARAVTSRAPEEPIQPAAAEPSALVRRPRSYCRARVARERALELHSAVRLGRRSRALQLGDVRLGPKALGSQD